MPESTRAPIRYVDELPSTADLVIVGGGIVGAATAFFAARGGLRALVVERRPRLAELTTAASTGAFRLQFDNEEEVALVRESVDVFSRLEEVTGIDSDVDLRRQGYLFASLSDEAGAHAARLVARQHAWGLTDVELLSGDEALHRFPYLSPAVRHARYRAGDGWLDPRKLAHVYAAAGANAERIPGAKPGGAAAFATATEVLDVVRSAERVSGVVTSRGTISADHVVIAAGPFTAELAARAGVHLDIRPTRRQKLILPDVPQVPPEAPMTIDEETAAHWRPAFRGCFALWTEPGSEPDAGPVDPVPTSASWAHGLLDPASDHALAKVAPFWRDVWDAGAATWYQQAGQYEYTPDRRPYLGPSGIDGLHINGGYSGHGIMASTAGSRIVVDLLTAATDPSANPFRVDRPMQPRELDIL